MAQGSPHQLQLLWALSPVRDCQSLPYSLMDSEYLVKSHLLQYITKISTQKQKSEWKNGDIFYKSIIAHSTSRYPSTMVRLDCLGLLFNILLLLTGSVCVNPLNITYEREH